MASYSGEKTKKEYVCRGLLMHKPGFDNLPKVGDEVCLEVRRDLQNGADARKGITPYKLDASFCSPFQEPLRMVVQSYESVGGSPYSDWVVLGIYGSGYLNCRDVVRVARIKVLDIVSCYRRFVPATKYYTKKGKCKVGGKHDVDWE